MDEHDLYAALLHETKNNLVLLTLTLDTVPHSGAPDHDEPLDSARLLAQRVSERLMQAMFLYKSGAKGISLNAVDAYAPADLLEEMALQARSLGKNLEISTQLDPELPTIWFYDRNMLSMALMNAIHNSVQYAHARIQLGARLQDGMLAITIRDDSEGYPAHILEAVARDEPLNSSGTGLGLRFASLIAHAHRNEGRTGELALYNDQGAVFEIRLP